MTVTVLGTVTAWKAQADRDAEYARLRKHLYFEPLKDLRGTVDSGFERVTTVAVFDYLGVPPKRRERRLHVVLADILKFHGWTVIYVREGGKPTSLVRSFERKISQTAAAPDAPVSAPAQTLLSAAAVIKDLPPEDTIVLRGRLTPLSHEDAKAFIIDCSRVAEGVTTTAKILFKYELTPEAWQELQANLPLDRLVRQEAERRIRNGSAAQELAQVNMPLAQTTLREILNDPKASPGYRVAAAKETREAATAARQHPGAGQQFSISINLGTAFNRELTVQNPQAVDAGRTLEYKRDTSRADPVPPEDEPEE
jgi:hypothetical protein